MTDPTPLSPAAQAVRDAVLATYAENIPKDDNLWALERASTVAALRAVADQYEIFFDAYDEPRRVVTVDDLLNIAAELES